MSQPLLSGEVEYLAEDSGPDQMEMLRMELSELREEINTVKTVLMRQYGAFRQAFGEQVIVNADSADKWGAIKQRLAPRLREAVDILLLQGSMKRTQLAAALKMNYSNCSNNVVGALIRQGWLIDNGGNLSLKQL